MSATRRDQGAHVFGASEHMLADLERVRDELRSAIGAMDAVTSELRADRYQVSNTRWRLSQSGLRGCTASSVILEYLMPRVDDSAAVALQSLQRTHLEVLRESSVHIGKWALDRIESDWSGYCKAYQGIRQTMANYIESEKRVLIPIVQQEARADGPRGRELAALAPMQASPQTNVPTRPAAD